MSEDVRDGLERSTLETFEHGLGRTVDDLDALEKLNEALGTLMSVFPHIFPEVLREMLRLFDGDSRLECIANEIISNPERWVKGRYQISKGASQPSYIHQPKSNLRTEFFRSDSYKKAVQAEIFKEFTTMSKSTIKAVLAEQNYDYGRARVSLHAVSAKRPLAIMKRFFSSSRNPTPDSLQHHPNIEWVGDLNGHRDYPLLRTTSSTELNQELNDTVLVPLLREYSSKQISTDSKIGHVLNRAEAAATGSFLECQCCFGETTFEEIAFCTEAEHATCFECITRSLKEALYGQGWSQMIDHGRGTMKCCAMGSEPCNGSIEQDLFLRALAQDSGHVELWEQYENRLFKNSAHRSGIALVHCPACSYSESSEIYVPPQNLHYIVEFTKIRTSMQLLFITFSAILVALLCSPFVILFPSILTHARSNISKALSRLKQTTLFPQRFICRSPTCGLASCLICCKPWQDPHTCGANAAHSLRLAIEAARTSAIKRTCPSCGLGFVKESGCNKLVCQCGYIMCYICRQGLSTKSKAQAYSHFCQHFRPHGGRCTSCDRCDLYRSIDDEEAVQLAGQAIEREWTSDHSFANGAEKVHGRAMTSATEQVSIEWSLKGFLDWYVGKIVICRWHGAMEEKCDTKLGLQLRLRWSAKPHGNRLA